MVGYAHGNGHQDLAAMLQVSSYVSLAESNSSNTKIIRTILRDSYTNPSTLYIVGLSFLGRLELPILSSVGNDGRWFSFQNEENKKFLSDTVLSSSEYDALINIKLKSESMSIEDRLENLMYQLLSMVDSLRFRGHDTVIFNTADSLYPEYLSNEKFNFLRTNSAFVQGLAWQSVKYQFEHGVAASRFDQCSTIPKLMQHVNPGEHRALNDFLFDYIVNHKLV